MICVTICSYFSPVTRVLSAETTGSPLDPVAAGGAAAGSAAGGDAVSILSSAGFSSDFVSLGGVVAAGVSCVGVVAGAGAAAGAGTGAGAGAGLASAAAGFAAAYEEEKPFIRYQNLCH